MTVINHKGVSLSIGDKIIIVSDKLSNRTLAMVDIGEVLTITGISNDGKILYHNRSLALPTNSDVYEKLG
jgi:hypothetical protein